MKKIIFTVTNDLSFDQRMNRICSTLADAGYAIELVGRKRSSSPVLEEQNYKQKRLSCWFDKGKLFYAEYNIRLFWYLLFRKVDIISAVDLDTLMPCYRVSRLKSVPCVFDAHEYFSEVPEVIHRPKVKRFWEGIANRIIPRLKYCYTVGPKLGEMFTEMYGVPFAVVRNVPMWAPLPIGAKDNTPKVILYQGALNAGRGLEELISAMKYIDNAVLHLAGEGDLSTSLREQVKAEKLEAKVLFLGFVPPKQLRKLTPNIDIGVNLLKSESLSYYYSLANKAFDYIQAGVPAINMDFPEYKALQEEHNCLMTIPDLETQTIVDALQRLLMDIDYYQTLEANCKIAREQLTWEKEREKLLEVYEQIVLVE